MTATAAAAALALAGCGGSIESDDPKGYETCEKFAEYHRDGDLSLEENVALGEMASLARTESIRAAAKATFDEEMMGQLNSANPSAEQVYFIDGEKLRAACDDAGR